MEHAETPRLYQLMSARKLAGERFAANSRTGLFLALGGLETDAAQVTLGETPMVIERLLGHPVISASESTLQERPLHQIVLPEVSMSEDSWAIGGILWTTIALLRLRCGGFFVPCEVAEYPWDVVDGIPVDHPDARFVPGGRRGAWWPEGRVPVSQEDADWVGANFDPTLTLRSDRRFHFGLECFSGAFEEQDIRMAISKIWAGVEGVLGISSELRFRIALYSAAVLAPAGPDRIERFRATAKLYDMRSKVVHGSNIEPADLMKCMSGSAEVLKGLLIDAITAGEVRSVRSFEEVLLGA